MKLNKDGTTEFTIIYVFQTLNLHTVLLKMTKLEGITELD